MLGALLAPDKDAWQVQRRRTLIFLLRQHVQGQTQPHQQPDLDHIYLLTQINHPHAFHPLRFFWNQGSREIRLGILNEAWRHFKQVESLEIIAEGLEAKEPSLQDAALKALDLHYFPTSPRRLGRTGGRT